RRRRPDERPHAPGRLDPAAEPADRPAAGAAAAARTAAAAASLLAGPGAGLLGDRDAVARRPGPGLRLRPGRRPGLRQPARRAGPAAGDHGLHPAALPRPAAFLPAVAAGAGDRRAAAQRPHRRRGGEPGAGAAAAAMGILVGAAAGPGAVAAAVPAAGRPAPGAPGLRPSHG